MSDISEPAFPSSVKSQIGLPVWTEGCTKRELFAAMAMQAFLHPKHVDELEEQALGPERVLIIHMAIAARSVDIADALLDALKEKAP